MRSVPNERKQQSFYAKMSDIWNAFLVKKLMYLLLYNDANLDINDSLPSIAIALLQDYKNVLILCSVQPFLIDQLIGVILRRQWNLKGKLRSCWQKDTLERV